MYKLIIEDDEGKTTVVPLIRDEITIGRKEGNTIRLTERNVSRRHAKLLKQNGTVYIEDLTSYNGIKVNGDRIGGRSPVNEGDRIQIGDYQLALKLDKTATVSTAPAAAAAAPAPAAPPSLASVPAPAPTAVAAEITDQQKTTPFAKDGATAAPAAMLDLAPTVQTPLGVAPPPISGQHESPARLVVVSSNFAGQEFVLDKAAVVIGRTDENDVVINHRSISRHHAKIVREGGHYHIVDLQSANGVRVNGEEYGKVELRKGDHIDLGHVRLRFVAAGEDFLFERDAQVVDVTGGKRSRAGLVVLFLLMVMALAGGAFALMKMTQRPNSVEVLHPSGDIEGQVARLLVDAERALKAEDWDAAIAKSEEALRLDGSQELARDRQKRAETERKNHTAYNNFLAAADKSNVDSALASYGELTEDSIYRQKGAERYAKVRHDYLHEHLDAAKKAKTAGRCEDAHQHIEAVLSVDEGNSEAQELLKSCGGTVKPATPRTPAAPRVKPPKPLTPVAGKPAPSGGGDDGAEANGGGTDPAAVTDMMNAYVHGQYATAIELAHKAVKFQASKAWGIIGASHCQLKDRAQAMQAWNKAGPKDRQLIRYVCGRNQITVP